MTFSLQMKCYIQLEEAFGLRKTTKKSQLNMDSIPEAYEVQEMPMIITPFLTVANQ